MAPVRIDPQYIKEMEKTTKDRNFLVIFQESGFLPYLHRFYGFDLVAALTFARTFDGSRAKVGLLEFTIIEDSIS